MRLVIDQSCFRVQDRLSGFLPGMSADSNQLLKKKKRKHLERKQKSTEGVGCYLLSKKRFAGLDFS